MDNSNMEEDKAKCDFTNASKTENSGNLIAQKTAAKLACAGSSYESIYTNPTQQPDNTVSPSEDPQPIQKSSLSYIALISKVILSSPLQKLNLASIYKAMEEQFPYLRSRGPGWRNSVRHNLSVNDCFVKVSRCEDGRGHYWGVHQAHLRDFQLGNFRQSRKARERRERAWSDKLARCCVCMKSSYFLRRLCESWMEPQYPLLEPQRYQMSSCDRAEAQYQPWSVNVGCIKSPGWVTHCYFPESQPCGPYMLATAGRRYSSQPLSSRLHRFVTPPVQPFCFPGCWCMSPAIIELIKPPPYTTFNFTADRS